MFPRLSLTLTMLLLTMSAGIAVWGVSQAYQNYQLSNIFQEILSERFNKEAREHRIRFYQHLKKYNPTVKIYADRVAAKNYIESEQWLSADKSSGLILHQDTPAWLPGLSIMRSQLWPRYAMLFDKSGELRELYLYRNPMPPEELLNITPYERELSRGQSYVTMRGNQPYVISTEYIGDNTDSSMLLIASPIDEELLRNSQGSETDNTIIA